jgi:hypothetical protein
MIHKGMETFNISPLIKRVYQKKQNNLIRRLQIKKGLSSTDCFSDCCNCCRTCDCDTPLVLQVRYSNPTFYIEVTYDLHIDFLGPGFDFLGWVGGVEHEGVYYTAIMVCNEENYTLDLYQSSTVFEPNVISSSYIFAAHKEWTTNDDNFCCDPFIYDGGWEGSYNAQVMEDFDLKILELPPCAVEKMVDCTSFNEDPYCITYGADPEDPDGYGYVPAPDTLHVSLTGLDPWHIGQIFFGIGPGVTIVVELHFGKWFVWGYRNRIVRGWIGSYYYTTEYEVCQITVAVPNGIQSMYIDRKCTTPTEPCGYSNFDDFYGFQEVSRSCAPYLYGYYGRWPYWYLEVEITA